MAEGYALRNGTVFRFTEGGHRPQATDVYLDGSCITGFSDSTQTPSRSYRTVDIGGLLLVPGAVDTHNHGGGNGCNATEGRYSRQTQTFEGGPDAELIDEILVEHAMHGTTTMFLSTLATDEWKLKRLLEIAGKIRHYETPGANFGGLDIEGTFLCPSDGGAYVGAQNREHFRPATTEGFRRIFGDHLHLVKRVGVGLEWCEVDPGYDTFKFLEYLSDRGIVPGIGHSGARYQQVVDAADMLGRMVFIHYGNGPNATNFKPGQGRTMEAIPRAARLNDHGIKIYAEQILDGAHLADGFTAYAYGLFGPDRIVGVTDNIGITGNPGIARLKVAGTAAVVSEKDPRALWIAGKEGIALCGSKATTMDHLLPHYVSILTNPDGTCAYFTGERLEPMGFDDAMNAGLKALCSSPTKLYGLGGRGRITEHAPADLVALKRTGDYPVEFSVEHVWVSGRMLK